jgi:hypothetical protein
MAHVRHPGVEVINFGPLRVTNRGAMPLALFSIQSRTSAHGPPLVVSPIEAHYLEVGEAVRRMPTIAERGPGGLRGLPVETGARVRLAITPGVTGRCRLLLRAAAHGNQTAVSATVGGVTRRGFILREPALLNLGPYPRAASVVSLRIGTGPRGSRTRVIIGDVRLLASR